MPVIPTPRFRFATPWVTSICRPSFTDPVQDAIQVQRWFVQRWQLAVTFWEARDYLGVEPQR